MEKVPSQSLYPLGLHQLSPPSAKASSAWREVWVGQGGPPRAEIQRMNRRQRDGRVSPGGAEQLCREGVSCVGSGIRLVSDPGRSHSLVVQI